MSRKKDNGPKEIPAYKGPRTPTSRTTLVLPHTVDANLEVYAVQTGLTKGELSLRLLVQSLRAAGFQPEKIPNVTITY